MFGNRDIPVYLFTGFLESGKSTCFQEILEEGNFEDGLQIGRASCRERV